MLNMRSFNTALASKVGKKKPVAKVLNFGRMLTGPREWLYGTLKEMLLVEMKGVLGLTPAIVANRLTVFEVREYMRIRIAAIEQRGRDEIEHVAPCQWDVTAARGRGEEEEDGHRSIDRQDAPRHCQPLPLQAERECNQIVRPESSPELAARWRRPPDGQGRSPDDACIVTSRDAAIWPS